MLVQLVGGRVGDPERERRPLAAERPQEQRAEHRELGGVRELPQDEIPRAEAGAEVGTDEKAKMTAAQRTTGAHRRSAAEVGTRPMIGSGPTNGAR